MALSLARTHAGISISIARDPSLVRTVRLVAAAFARRASSDEEFVEEVRLAVGEACAVMVSGMVTGGGTAGTAPFAVTEEAHDKVRLDMEIADRLRVAITCAGEELIEPPSHDGVRVDPWALLRGLAEDLVVKSEDGSLDLSMSWPV